MRLPKWVWISGGAALLAGLAFFYWQPEYAYVPSARNVINPGAGDQVQTAAAGAAKSGSADLELGRKAFYGETFGNEVFLTDIMGILDGPITWRSFARALLELRGRGTTNLQVRLEHDVTINGRTLRAGTKVDTGLDVPKGSWAPLGMPVKFARGQIKAGITCAACHATVGRDTLQVVEGAPNADLNNGLLMALATNSTAYFTHTDVSVLERFVKSTGRVAPTADGKSTVTLPDPPTVEAAVDATLTKWPPGFFDSTIDLKANPTKIPHSFTLGNHPYGWSGFAAAGPFHGLAAFSNNVHAQNSDSLSQAEAAPILFGMDRERYLGTILQNAANPRFRYVPDPARKPSDFFAAIDPTPGEPGVNELIKQPTWPKVTPVAPDGMFANSPGTKVWQQIMAMAAWQNTLVPPPAKGRPGPADVAQGRAVFERAGCITCHAGPAGTNNRVLAAPSIGTDPSRAAALKKTGPLFDAPSVWPFALTVPIPLDAKPQGVPTDHLDPEQVKLAWAHGDAPGGYKVQGLMGLAWTAPYLHDGGVAVGADVNNQIGLPGTLLRGIAPDPFNSLRALLDRDLRAGVVAANRADPQLGPLHISGTGHAFWVDQTAGFSQSEQDALIRYVLSFPPPHDRQ